MKTNPLLLTDFYKIGHPFQYPEGTTMVYSNFTPRKSRMPGVNKMVHFGLQYFIIEYLQRAFNDGFFARRLGAVMDEYSRTIKRTLGSDLKSYEHIDRLHDLGYLPIYIRSLPEGTIVPMRVPTFTINNTVDHAAWLTNRLETLASSIVWQPSTSATIAKAYREVLDGFAAKTGMPAEFVQWQGHDFSFRGMGSLEAAITSGMGHLLSFTGTDTIPAILAAEEYYGANIDSELIGGSVPATEHSVMCAGSKDGELETFRRLITDVYPTGIVSIVSDTWDLWKVLTEYMPAIKDVIVARPGRVVIRPDSGDPEKILCGDPSYPDGDPRRDGVVRLLWKVFGGLKTSTGHTILHPAVGAIYGDSITIERARSICANLESQGFASQVVFGIGSYTYQHNTRDTFGTAIKATKVIVNGDEIDIWKQPITDDGTKYSARGYLSVVREGGELKLIEGSLNAPGNLLQPVFYDGTRMNWKSFEQVRETLRNSGNVIS